MRKTSKSATSCNARSPMTRCGVATSPFSESSSPGRGVSGAATGRPSLETASLRKSSSLRIKSDSVAATGSQSLDTTSLCESSPLRTKSDCTSSPAAVRGVEGCEFRPPCRTSARSSPWAPGMICAPTMSAPIAGGWPRVVPAATRMPPRMCAAIPRGKSSPKSVEMSMAGGGSLKSSSTSGGSITFRRRTAGASAKPASPTWSPPSRSSASAVTGATACSRAVKPSTGVGMDDGSSLRRGNESFRAAPPPPPVSSVPSSRGPRPPAASSASAHCPWAKSAMAVTPADANRAISWSAAAFSVARCCMSARITGPIMLAAIRRGVQQWTSAPACVVFLARRWWLRASSCARANLSGARSQKLVHFSGSACGAHSWRLKGLGLLFKARRVSPRPQGLQHALLEIRSDRTGARRPRPCRNTKPPAT
mmetsp:Transcript_34592/g.99646  ORF Transcript_34592/g.99646 Transcript_34592/m.99646 type:complete len:423 (+) Transcript_34592:521-1789(+)